MNGHAILEGGPSAPLSLITIESQYGMGHAADQVDEADDHIRLSSKRGLPSLKLHDAHDGVCIIVGSGASVKAELDNIKDLSSREGSFTFGVNDSHGWLLRNGVVPNGQVLLEIGPDAFDFLKYPDKRTTYFVSSMCHPHQFDDLDGMDIQVWHPWSDEDKHLQSYQECYPNSFMVMGGTATGLRTINVALTLGYRKFALFGFDSSFHDGDESHFNGPAYGDVGPIIDVIAVGPDGRSRKFKTYPYLARQADEFRRICKAHHQHFVMRVYGDGLLPFVHRTMFPQMYL